MSAQPAPTVMVACDDLILLDEMIRHLEEIPQWRLVGSVRSVADLTQGCLTSGPEAVLLAGALAVELAHESNADTGDAAIIVFGRTGAAEELRAALDLGARGYVQWPEEKSQVRPLVEGSIQLPSSAEKEQSPLHAVWAPKGGAGASVVAAHLAAALAHQGKDCLLVDVDLDHGDQASILDLRKEVRTIGDLVAITDELTPEVARSVVDPHPSGFGVIHSPASPGSNARLGSDLVTALRTVRQLSDYVIADLPSGLADLSTQVLRSATSVVLVLTPDLLCLRRAKAALDVLRPMGLGPERIRVVLNQFGGPHIAPREVERVLGVKGVVKVRADYEIYRSVNRGELCGSAVKMLAGLAKRLAALSKTARPRIPRPLRRRPVVSGRSPAPDPETAPAATWTE